MKVQDWVLRITPCRFDALYSLVPNYVGVFANLRRGGFATFSCSGQKLGAIALPSLTEYRMNSQPFLVRAYSAFPVKGTTVPFLTLPL